MTRVAPSKVSRPGGRMQHGPAMSPRPARLPTGRRQGDAKADAAASGSLKWPVFLFLLSLAIPWIIAIGPLRLSAYRLVLVAMIVPCIAMWMGGKAGRIRLPDIAFLVYCLWCFISIVTVHGTAFALEPAGIIFIETMGAYLLARCFIRSADDFHAMVQLLYRMVLLLAPFALFEAYTGRNVLLEVFSTVAPTSPDIYMEPRWGLRRVHAVFEHPILFGVIASSIFALTHLVLGYGKSLHRRWLSTGIVGLTAFMSLSAGPITALTAQGLLLGWNWVLRNVRQRWKILTGFFALAFVAAELLTNRSLPVIFISYFAFDEESAFVRIAIWRYGSQSVMNHPLVGIGFNEWARPPWMTSSIDMFWIIDAIRHGIIAELAIMGAFFGVFLGVAFKQGLDERISAYRTGFLIALTGFFLVGWTVYFWNAAYVLFIFLIGSGVWMMDVDVGTPSARQPQRQHHRCTAFRHDT